MNTPSTEKILTSTSQNRQWIVAATLPLLREFNLWLDLKLSYRAADSKDSSIEIYRTFWINTGHCIGLCSYLGASITTISTWIIVGADSLLNAYHTIKLILMKRKNMIRSKLKEAEIHLTTIILSEVIEAVVPLTFLIIFILFYYGPNAEQYGQVKSSQFHYKPVEKVDRYVFNLLFFFIVDLFALVLTSLGLWIFGKINMIRGYLCLERQFWRIMAMQTAARMVFLFAANRNGNAQDLTFEFAWLNSHNMKMRRNNMTL